METDLTTSSYTMRRITKRITLKYQMWFLKNQLQQEL